MSGFTACGAGARTVPPDPGKRVNFVHGLVLGADDLTQESAYLANRTEWLARDLIGYGTVADCASAASRWRAAQPSSSAPASR